MNLTEKSLNQKILNYAKSIKADDVNKIRTTVALERLVARIQSSSFLEDKIIFCGGFVLYKEGLTDRYTRDVDMISSEENQKQVVQEIKNAIELDLGDGFWFGETIIEDIAEEVEYGGVRFKPLYKVGTPFPTKENLKKLRRVHLDLSFKFFDVKLAKKSELMATIDQYDEISWNIYPLEYIAAEKVHAIISRGGLSTRSKDVYDLYFILDKCDKTKLKNAITFTFNIRDTALEESVSVTLSSISYTGLSTNWKNVEFKGNKLEFDVCWQGLIHFFEKL